MKKDKKFFFFKFTLIFHHRYLPELITQDHLSLNQRIFLQEKFHQMQVWPLSSGTKSMFNLKKILHLGSSDEQYKGKIDQPYSELKVDCFQLKILEVNFILSFPFKAAQCAYSYRGKPIQQNDAPTVCAKGSSGSFQYFTASNFFILALVLLLTSFFKFLYIEHASDFCMNLEDIFCKRKVLFEDKLVHILLSYLFNELTGTVSINSYFEVGSVDMPKLDDLYQFCTQYWLQQT